MKVKQFGLESLFKRAASSEGICLDIGCFCVRVKSCEISFLKTLAILYQDFPILLPDTFADFHIVLQRPRGVRHYLKSQILFISDGQQLFEPFPASHAFPLFEWGLNWCIARRSHQNLMLHAAVVEKHGKALILPAFPGSGKSTLSAALAQRGWRFLSDEFGLIRATDGQVIPIPRPTSLKNESIKVIRDFSPKAVIGPLFPKTRKGTVAHLRAPTNSVKQMKTAARPTWVIFPRYQPEADLQLNELVKPYALMKLATNAFNYEVMGQRGFELVRDIVNSCTCFNLVYSNFDEVITRLDELVEAHV